MPKDLTERRTNYFSRGRVHRKMPDFSASYQAAGKLMNAAPLLTGNNANLAEFPFIQSQPQDVKWEHVEQFIDFLEQNVEFAAVGARALKQLAVAKDLKAHAAARETLLAKVRGETGDRTARDRSWLATHNAGRAMSGLEILQQDPLLAQYFLRYLEEIHRVSTKVETIVLDFDPKRKGAIDDLKEVRDCVLSFRAEARTQVKTVMSAQKELGQSTNLLDNALIGRMPLSDHALDDILKKDPETVEKESNAAVAYAQAVANAHAAAGLYPGIRDAADQIRDATVVGYQLGGQLRELFGLGFSCELGLGLLVMAETNANATQRLDEVAVAIHEGRKALRQSLLDARVEVKVITPGDL